MDNDLLERASELNRAGAAFVLATVVRAEKPTSAKPGANAIITGNGTLTGWVGGSCAEHTVLSQARKALRDGQPRLVRLCPPEKLGTAPQDGVIEVALTCESGGTLEVYIEPHLPRPHLVVIGHLPVALSLARLGSGLGYEVSVMGPSADDGRWTMDDEVGGKATGSRTPSSMVHRPSSAEGGVGHVHVFNNLDFSHISVTPQTYIVVASHGNYDEEGLTGALMSDAPYVALVASRKRGESVVQFLRESGIPPERLARLKYPAGLDIGAVTPEEIALSILAEILQVRRQRQEQGQEQGQEQESEDGINRLPPVARVEQNEQLEAIDPVCGMTVEIASARYKSEHAGQAFYFCAAGCKRSFDKDPHRYRG